MKYRQVQSISGKGAHSEQFATALRSIAVDRQDRLYAAGDSEIKVFSSEGKLIKRWPAAKPCLAVAVAANGYVYAGQEGQVEVFDGRGKLLDTWRSADLLARVSAIGFLKSGILFGDARNRCIRHYDANGKYRNTIGKSNRTEGLLIPNGVVSFSTDADENIHAADPGKHRVERYTVGDQLLGHIGRFDGVNPAGFPGCCNPTNVAVTGRDRIYVTEKAWPRVKVYDFTGNLLSVIASEVFDQNCKNMAIAVNSHGRVYVTDTERLAILAFAPNPDSQREGANHE